MDRQETITTLEQAVELIRHQGATFDGDDRQANRDAIYLDAIAVCIEHDHVTGYAPDVTEALELATRYLESAEVAR